ncbi:MAG TPA: cytochrome P450 [Acidimicrobiales bacterium]|nr:cytochrome P450 [Acidimicrobiales bacterium]
MSLEPSVDTLDPGQVRANLTEAAELGPTAQDALTGAVWVFGYNEIERLARDSRLEGVGMTMFDLMGIEGELRLWYGSLMFANEGAEHIRLRRLVNRAFTTRSTEQLRADAAASVEALLDELASNGEGDLVAMFERLPIRVMCRLLGVPEEDISTFAGWADALSRVFTFMEPSEIAAAESALSELLDYVANLVRRRQADPGEDLITSLLRAEDEGDRLSRDEVITMVSNLLVAGHDTTRSQIGCSLAAMLSHPDCLERLRGGEATLGSAVAETMRYEPNISGIPRTVKQEVEVGGITREQGAFILLAVMIGNRDPSVWDDPNGFDVSRFDAPSAPRLLSFGTGPHFCLGTNLARMTLEETLQGTLLRPIELLCAPEDIKWQQVLGRSPVSLPVTIR